MPPLSIEPSDAPAGAEDVPSWFRPFGKILVNVANDSEMMRGAIDDSRVRVERVERFVFGSKPPGGMPGGMPSSAPAPLVSMAPLTIRVGQAETGVAVLREDLVVLSQQLAALDGKQDVQSRAAGLPIGSASRPKRAALFIFSRAGLKMAIHLMTLVCAALGLLAGMRSQARLSEIPAVVAPMRQAP
jgi:hypothetical protein